MSIEAGDLRHRVRIERQVQVQDSNGDMLVSWQTVATVWAAIKPLSAREFIQSQAMQSEVIGRIVIRHTDNIDPSMRLVHTRIGRPSVIYNIHGILPDPDSGLEYLTLPVSTGVNDGR